MPGSGGGEFLPPDPLYFSICFSRLGAFASDMMFHNYRLAGDLESLDKEHYGGETFPASLSTFNWKICLISNLPNEQARRIVISETTTSASKLDRKVMTGRNQIAPQIERNICIEIFLAKAQAEGRKIFQFDTAYGTV